MKTAIIANRDILEDRAAYTRLILGGAVPLEELEPPIQVDALLSYKKIHIIIFYRD